MEPVVFLEKVRRPDPRGLVRDRLERRLLDTDAAPVRLILGPPGSGKSTLLARVAGSTQAPVGWYRVSEEDSSETFFIAHLAHAISSALPTGLDRAASESLAALVTALDAEPNELLVVVDDLHEIAGTPAEKALERFVAVRPRSVRLLLSSRRPPALNITRLLVSGELLQLDGDDLRFRSWEVEELFRTVHGAPLSPETAAALTRRTGGWAAGLQLFHLATAGLSRADREQAVEELSGRSRLIRSYLARNVLDGLPPERRSFLVRTAALGVLTGEACDALLHRTGSAAVLDDLEQQQFFTTSTDGGQTYRYHQVLQTHLEIVLVDELGVQGARELYSASARLLEESGRAAAAVRAHARAEDWGAVARLLHPSAPADATADDVVWNAARMPGVPSDDPSLVLAGARRLMRNGLVAEAVAAFTQAESLMDDPDFQARCANQRQQAALWLPQASLQLRLPGPATRSTRLSAELRQATISVRNPDQLSFALSRGLAWLLAGDLPAAERALRSGLTQPQLTTWEQLALRLGLQLTQLWSEPDPGRPAQLEEVILTAELEGLPWVSRMARGLQAAADLAADPTAWRIEAGRELLGDCERHSDSWTLGLLATVLGAAYALVGQDRLAEEPLRRAEEVATELGAPVLQVWATALRTALARRNGNSPAVDAAEVAGWAHALGADGAARLLTGSGLPAPPSSQPGEAPDPSPPSATVELQLLGGFGLRVAGLPLDLSELRPRARAVLMMLALHSPRDVHREHLVDALWPDATLASGVRSLQVAISSLRQCLGGAGLNEDVVQRHGDAYALALGSVSSDRNEFERLAHEADRVAQTDPHGRLAGLLAAAAAYRGDLLPELGPADWVVEERDRLRAAAAGVLARAATLALELDEPAVGLSAAQRSVELEPYHDHVWELLAALHERLGDRSAAAVARRDHARHCAELGLPS